MSMIERCARKLAAQHYADRFRLPEDAALVMTNVDGNWYLFVNQVMTVIESLREPTDAMVEAGKTPGWSHWEVRGRFNLMIDAALNEEPPSTPHQISIATSIVEMTNATLKEQEGH
jgi:hypothetical protein